MKSLFFKTLIAFLFALFIFMIIMLFILSFGFNNSIIEWENERTKTLKYNVEKIIENIVSTNTKITPAIFNKELKFVLPGNAFITIYDKEKKALFTIKKQGMRRGARHNYNDFITNSKDLIPIKIEDRIIFYFSIHFLNFREDYTNKKFLGSIRITILVSLFTSFLIASIFALFFSRNLSTQSKNVSKGIDLIAQGDLNVHIDEKGTKEIALIAKSANILTEKLKKEEQLRNQWAEDIAHDLRTPVTAIKSQLEGIKDKVLEYSTDRIDKNLRELRKIEDLINDLAELTKLESPEIKINPEKININTFFDELKSSFQHDIEMKKIDFRIKSLINHITGDKRLLNRALSNILNNAVKLTKNNGKIKMSAYRNDDKTIFEIFNSDSYISQEEQTKIFDRLYRGEYSRSTSGTGLGLTIAKKIIELHDGNITIKSKKNIGTSFIITI